MPLFRKIEPRVSDKKRIYYDKKYCLPLVGFLIENLPKEIKPVFIRKENLKSEMSRQ